MRAWTRFILGVLILGLVVTRTGQAQDIMSRQSVPLAARIGQVVGAVIGLEGLLV